MQGARFQLKLGKSDIQTKTELFSSWLLERHSYGHLHTQSMKWCLMITYNCQQTIKLTVNTIFFLFNILSSCKVMHGFRVAS